MARSTAREVAMQLIYERMLGGDGGEKSLELIGVSLEGEDSDYVQDVLSGVFSNRERIDSLIERYSQGWTLLRMARVDLATLRLAVYEICYREDIPYGASINEAVEISQKYSTDTSGGFINGVLGTMLRTEPELA